VNCINICANAELQKTTGKPLLSGAGAGLAPELEYSDLLG
jgi:hypothetical protein